MMHARLDPNIAEIAIALDELRRVIATRFPDATFVVEEGDDPTGIYLVATVDTDDPDEVTDLTVDRVMELQVDRGLPIFVIPLRTPERSQQVLDRLEDEAHLPPPPISPQMPA